MLGAHSHQVQWRIQDLPWGGGHQPHKGGCPTTNVAHFEKCVCQNKRIGTLGVHSPDPPVKHLHMHPGLRLILNGLSITSGGKHQRDNCKRRCSVSMSPQNCKGRGPYQYIKEYKVGHRARKRDHFERAVFVLIVGEGRGQIDDQHREDQQSTFTLTHGKLIASVDSGGGGSFPRES